MDEDRKIRFLVAPSIFLFLLAVGFIFSNDENIKNYLSGISLANLSNIKLIIILITGGGLALFSLGFIIGSITYIFLSFICILCKIKIFFKKGDSFFYKFKKYINNTRYYELNLKEKSNLILKENYKIETINDYNCGMSFVHDYLLNNNKGIYDWVFRQWSAFTMASTSAVAVLLSYLIMWQFNIICLCPVFFKVILIVLFILFSFHAFLAWKNTMDMLNFQVEILDKAKPSENKKRPRNIGCKYLHLSNRNLLH